jgi:hypothetical protein
LFIIDSPSSTIVFDTDGQLLQGVPIRVPMRIGRRDLLKIGQAGNADLAFRPTISPR